MVSELKVNFHKIYLMGVNVSSEKFLNCRVEAISFMKLSTWDRCSYFFVSHFFENAGDGD